MSLLGLCIALAACQRSDQTPAAADGKAAPDATPAFPSMPNPALAAIPLGDVAGAATQPDSSKVRNPYAHDAQAVEDGKVLFVAMNCAGCHAYNGGGAMGPDLTDSYWRYGESPAQIYKSILEGRPQGMPSWGKALPSQEIWKLVAYIESLSSAGAAGTPESSASARQAGSSEGTGLGHAERK
jgi:cytochrome c oxidase cbb3-type subunit 3